MKTKDRIEMYFEYGFVISREEQAEHDRAIFKIQRETKALIKRLAISMELRFATINRNKEQNEII